LKATLTQVTFVTRLVSVTASAGLTHVALTVRPALNISSEICKGGLVPPFLLLYIAFTPG